MAEISELPDILIGQIAAGEVVERPASVIKELVENSLDAGASRVDIEVLEGGLGLLQVSDNGSGMRREDALLSIRRHMTSKISSLEDLSHILTFGFRGEALASVASVSHFCLNSRAKGDVVGTRVSLNNGKNLKVDDVAMGLGTRVEVKNLFSHIPARKQFLKSLKTERSHIDFQLKLYALSYPQVHFTYHKEGSLVWDLPPSKDFRERIFSLMGDSLRGELIEIPFFQKEGIKGSGYLLPASFSRRGRRQMFFFLNKRPIDSPVISKAVREGFYGGLPLGKYPTCWLWLDVDPRWVDVNVHPAKREVRFSDEGMIYRFAYHLVRSAFTKSFSDDVSNEVSVSQSEESASQSDSEYLKSDHLMAHPLAFAETQLTYFSENEEKREEINVLALFGKKYAVLESEEGLLLMDFRRSWERVLHNEWVEKAENNQLKIQDLLIPLLFDFEVRDLEFLKEYKADFEKLGIYFESFGGSSVQLMSIPDFLEMEGLRDLIFSVFDEIRGGTHKSVSRLAFSAFFSPFLRRFCSLKKMKTKEEVEVLANRLFASSECYTSPVDGLTLFEISFADLERKFSR